jgi:hypothetical protein
VHFTAQRDDARGRLDVDVAAFDIGIQEELRVNLGRDPGVVHHLGRVAGRLRRGWRANARHRQEQRAASDELPHRQNLPRASYQTQP